MVLRQIAVDLNVYIGTRLDAAKLMWDLNLKSDVAGVAAAVTSDTGDQPKFYGGWDGLRASRSDIELLCVLLENSRVQRPLTHPLSHTADNLLPQLGEVLRDSELRQRFRSALDRFENPEPEDRKSAGRSS